MGFHRGPNIVRDGLVLALDAASPRSYPGSGTTWYDLSGNGNNGALQNGPAFTSDNNGAISFDGSDDIVRITHTSSIDFTTNSFSLNCWVRTDQVGSTKMIMGKGDGIAIASNKGYNLYLGNAGTTWLFGVWDGTGNTSAGSTDYVEVDTWVNLCGVYNSTDNSHKLYTNSELVDTDIRAVDSISTTYDLYVGAGQQGQGDWDGDIAIAQIYNRALTASEVLQNYNATRSRFGL